MSMDEPNEYEQAIEVYAEAVRRQNKAMIDLEAAKNEENNARFDRQEKWRAVSAFVNEGKIKPGIYRLRSWTAPYSNWADAILIEKHHDYPEIFLMFR